MHFIVKSEYITQERWVHWPPRCSQANPKNRVHCVKWIELSGVEWNGIEKKSDFLFLLELLKFHEYSHRQTSLFISGESQTVGIHKPISIKCITLCHKSADRQKKCAHITWNETFHRRSCKANFYWRLTNENKIEARTMTMCYVWFAAICVDTCVCYRYQQRRHHHCRSIISCFFVNSEC